MPPLWLLKSFILHVIVCIKQRPTVTAVMSLVEEFHTNHVRNDTDKSVNTIETAVAQKSVTQKVPDDAED